MPCRLVRDRLTGFDKPLGIARNLRRQPGRAWLCPDHREKRGRDPEARLEDADVVLSRDRERLLSVGDDARRGQREVDVVEGRVFVGRWWRRETPMAT